MGNEIAKEGNPDVRGTIRAMDKRMQARYHRGVNYNLRVIIRGDRGVGKSCLLERLCGGGFKSDYTPTEKIEVRHVHWNYKVTDDIVKVEVWDVVDRGEVGEYMNVFVKAVRKSKEKGENKEDEEEEDSDAALERAAMAAIEAVREHKGKTPSRQQFAPLDASSVDVYKGTNAVIFVINLTKPYTLEYVQREMPNVPKNVHVLILGNFADQMKKRSLSSSLVESYVEELRGEGRVAHFHEVCMVDCFGMKAVHCFFNLPFLQVQRDYLTRLMEQNTLELEAAKEEVKLLSSTYSDYLKKKAIREAAEAKAALENPPPLQPKPKPKPVVKKEKKKKKSGGLLSSFLGIQKEAPPKPVEKEKKKKKKKGTARGPVGSTLDDFQPGEVDDGFFSSSDDEVQPSPEEKEEEEEVKNPMMIAVEEEPSEEEEEEVKNPMMMAIEEEPSEEEEEEVKNPMMMAVEEDITSDEEEVKPLPKNPMVMAVEEDITSDEEEKEPKPILPIKARQSPRVVAGEEDEESDEEPVVQEEQPKKVEEPKKHRRKHHHRSKDEKSKRKHRKKKEGEEKPTKNGDRKHRKHREKKEKESSGSMGVDSGYEVI